MRYLPYLLKHLRRSWVRSGSTVLGLALCILLFCTLRSVIAAVNWGVESSQAERLVTRHAVSLVFNLPLSYAGRIAGVPGVRRVAVTSWFGGVYQDMKNFFPNFAVEPQAYLAMHPEYILTDAEKEAFIKDRRGCIIGPDLASRFAWSVGDTFQMESIIPPYRVGTPFEFVVKAIYRVDDGRYPGTHPGMMFFHFDYLYEGTGQRIGAGTYSIQIDDPSRAGEISRQVDDLFENSEAQTRTETEAAFRASFVSLAGNLALLLNTIAMAVIFTILLVTANTMSMAVRERQREIAVLKTLGFSSGKVLALVLAEAMLLGAVGGLLGVFLGWAVIGIIPQVPFLGDAVRAYPSFGLSPVIAGLGLALATGLGLAAGLVPAILAYRSRVTQMLRQV